MILVDTSVLIELLRGEVKADTIEGYGTPASCFPVQCELYKGTRMARNTEKGEKHVEKLLQRLDDLEAGAEAARKYAKLKQEYTDINDIDLMIAGICLANNAEILTQDKDFQKIDGLKAYIP